MAVRGVGDLPEIADGDPPHATRGCIAQAWSVGEALRAWHEIAGAKRPAKRIARAPKSAAQAEETHAVPEIAHSVPERSDVEAAPPTLIDRWG